jgi:hypothetical protein
VRLVDVNVVLYALNLGRAAAVLSRMFRRSSVGWRMAPPDKYWSLQMT